MIAPPKSLPTPLVSDNNLELEGVKVVVGDVPVVASVDGDIQVHTFSKFVAKDSPIANIVRNIQNNNVGSASLREPLTGTENNVNLEGGKISVIRFEKFEGDRGNIIDVVEGDPLERSIVTSIENITEHHLAIPFTIVQKSDRSTFVGFEIAPIQSERRVMCIVIDKLESSLNPQAIAIK